MKSKPVKPLSGNKVKVATATPSKIKRVPVAPAKPATGRVVKMDMKG